MAAQVSVLKDHNRSKLGSNIKRLIEMIGGIQTIVRPSDTVLIKPNVLCGLKAETGATVCPETTAAIVELCRDAGASTVMIGEASNWGIDTMEAFRACGYDNLAEYTGSELVDLKMDEQVEVSIDDPIHNSILLPKTVFNVDVVIDIPVLKTHNQTIVSISLKNLSVGICNDQMKKSRIHSIGLYRPLPDELRVRGSELDFIIASLSKVLPCHLAVVDGFFGMHGFGSPIKGEPANAGLLAAGTDRVAVDAVCTDLIGLDPQRIPHIVLSGEKEIGTLKLDEIQVVGDPPESIRTPFREAIIEDIKDLAPDNVRIVCENACYSCVSNLGYFLKEHREQLEHLGPVTFVIGRTPASSVEKIKGRIVYYGNCAGIEMYGGGFVPGCVPRSRRQVFEALGIGEQYQSYEW